MRPVDLALAALLLAASAAAQEIESLPLAPPSETPGATGNDAGASEDIAPGAGGRFVTPPGTEEGAARGRAAVEFKRAPFTTARPGGPAPIETEPVARREGAVLRLLDMMTAETERVELAAGETRRVARLRVALSACAAPEDGTTQGTRAHLTIRDGRADDGAPVFEGWMFAASPALSAMDHRRYDLWLISCTSTEGAVASGSE